MRRVVTSLLSRPGSFGSKRSLVTNRGVTGSNVSKNLARATLSHANPLSLTYMVDDKPKASLYQQYLNSRSFSTSNPAAKSTATSSPKKEPEEEDDDIDAEIERAVKESPAKVSKIRLLWQKYGIVFVGAYGGLYLVTLGSVFQFVSFGHIDAHGVVQYLHSIGVDNYVDVSPIATSKAGNFALAWILTKFTEPLRLAFTVTITPSLARYLGYAPPKKSKKINNMPSSSEAAEKKDPI